MKNKFKTPARATGYRPKMYTPWGERAEISQRKYDGKFQLEAFMIPPDLSSEYYDYPQGEVPEWLNQGRWVVTHVGDTAEVLLKEVEYR